jgi:transmembrane sensor
MNDNSDIQLLLRKYISKTITVDELREFRTLLKNCPAADVKSMFQSEWDSMGDVESLDASLKFSMFAEIQKRIRPHKSVRWIRWSIGVAASVLILLLSTLSYYLYSTGTRKASELSERNIEVKVAKGERVTVTLPDGSIVRLNSESVLSYHQNFGLEDRNLNLNGEGFFDVVHNADQPFVVHTHCLNVKVLGTRFNVYAYENSDSVEMDLVKGCVDVTTVNPPYQSMRVIPNQKVIYSKSTGKMKLIRTSNKFETAWLTNQLVFRSVPLKEVLNLVGRKYGVTFNIDTDKFVNDLYTGVFDEKNINEVMDILKINFKFKYRIKDDTVWIYY